MLAVLSLVALLAAPAPPPQTPPQDFAALPAGAPEMSGWEQYDISGTGTLGTPKSAKGKFHLADMVIHTGLCADDDTPCVVTVSCRSHIVVDMPTKSGDWYIRWILTANGKRAEGVLRMIAISETQGSVAFWIRDGTEWKSLAEGSEDYRVSRLFLDFLVELLTRTHQQEGAQ